MFFFVFVFFLGGGGEGGRCGGGGRTAPIDEPAFLGGCNKISTLKVQVVSHDMQ